MFCRTVFGRNCLGLLASLILAPQYSPCQTDRAEPNPRVVQNFVSQPDVAPLPTRDQIPIRPPISSPITINFPAISRAAGLIFSGTVTRVERRPAVGQAIETVAITFHIENAIRGATPGQDLTIAQWIGLWSSGQRYRVGERVLLFLYPPSKLGLTSCVAGSIGRFQIDAWGRVLLSAQHLSLFRTDPVLGGKSRLRLSDFALAVRQADEEE